MDRDRNHERDDVLIEEEVAVVREGDVRDGDDDHTGADTGADRREVLEGVVPEMTDEPQSTPRPDFGRGQEEDPLRIEGMVEDRFSRGQEQDPTLHEQVHEGDFARGQSERPRHPETGLEGRFARGQQSTDPGSPNEPDDVVEDDPERPDR